MELVVAAAELRYGHPDSYPDEILDLPKPLAVRYLLRAVPVAELLASRFRSSIHLGLGVNIPSSLQMHLSAGLKYMFPPRLNKDVIFKAWDDFKDRLRWRYYFTLEEKKEGSQSAPYDPDYEVKQRRKPCKHREEFIEKGLDEGWTYLQNYAEEVVPMLKA